MAIPSGGRGWGLPEGTPHGVFESWGHGAEGEWQVSFRVGGGLRRASQGGGGTATTDTFKGPAWLCVLVRRRAVTGAAGRFPPGEALPFSTGQRQGMAIRGLL